MTNQNVPGVKVMAKDSLSKDTNVPVIIATVFVAVVKW